MLLLRLLVSAGTPVPLDTLIDELWPDEMPTTAANQVQGYVSRLRKLLAADELVVTRSSAYELAISPDDVDATLFERLAEEGQAALQQDRADDASRSLGQALALWRGPALGAPAQGPTKVEADRLDELRKVVHEASIEAQMASGRPAASLVPELQAMVEEHPLRERRWELLLLALHRSGRTADALTEYQRVYRLLDTELGVAPGEGLTTLHAQILAADPALEPADAARLTVDVHVPEPRQPVESTREVPKQLPFGVGDFTGRTAEIDRLHHWLDAVSAAGWREPSAMLLTGSGGIGKSALAIQAAHRLADRFPGGQIYVNLRGFSTAPPLRPIQAIAPCLHALGVAADHVPTDEDEAVGLYRTALAGRRVLLVLDNVADSEQLLPLLPPAGSVALATSRHSLSRLAATGRLRRMMIGPLPHRDAHALLASIAGDARLRAEPEAAADLVGFCAGMPLATRIAGAHLAEDPETSIRAYVDMLDREQPLDVLRADDGGEAHPEASVGGTFSVSYRRLSPEVARAFCLIGLLTGDEFTLLAAAALFDTAPSETRRILAVLCDSGLLERAGRDQYHAHDLLRAYARDCRAARLSEVEVDAACERFVIWCADACADAVRLAFPPMPGALSLKPVPADLRPRFAGRVEASRWLDRWRSTLRAIAETYASHPTAPVWRLAAALRTYFMFCPHPRDAAAIASAGMESARENGDERAQAAMALMMGTVTLGIADSQATAQHLEQGLELARVSGWTAGEAALLSEAGLAQIQLGDVRAGTVYLEQALGRFKALGSPREQASAVFYLGIADMMRGQLRAAEERFTALLRAAPESHATAVVRVYLGAVRLMTGDPASARTEALRAQDIMRQSGYHSALWRSLIATAAAEADLGNPALALELVDEALAAAEVTSRPEFRSMVMVIRGEVRLADHDPDGCLADAREAQRLAISSAPYEHAAALRLEARALLASHRDDEAQEVARRAVHHSAASGYELLAASASMALAIAEHRLGSETAAIARAQQARAVLRTLKYARGIARADELLEDWRS